MYRLTWFLAWTICCLLTCTSAARANETLDFDVVPGVPPEPSSITISLTAALLGTQTDSSALSGQAQAVFGQSTPPFGIAQLTELTMVLDDGMDFSLAGGTIRASAAPGEARVTMTEPGLGGSVVDGKFDQLGNFFRFEGEIFLSTQEEPYDLSQVSELEADLLGITLSEQGPDLIADVMVDLQFDGVISNVPILGTLPITIRVEGAARAVTTRTLPGDLDGDGVLDAGDIDVMAEVIRSQFGGAAFYDLNGDQQVNEDDYDFLIVELMNTYYGDSNLDGEFNSTDFVNVFLTGLYEDGVPLNASWETGDWNGDADFGTADFVKAFLEGGYEVGPRTPAAVPEPCTLWSTITGALLLFCRRKDRPAAR